MAVGPRRSRSCLCPGTARLLEAVPVEAAARRGWECRSRGPVSPEPPSGVGKPTTYGELVEIMSGASAAVCHSSLQALSSLLYGQVTLQRWFPVMSSDFPAAGANTGLSAACPLSLELDIVAAMLNFELPDHPIYDSGELLWFDDVDHGTGMMAFLRRRSDRRTDYYPQPGLRLDPSDFYLGGGIGSWTVTEFIASQLQITRDGVAAEARFVDVDGRSIEIFIDDRDGSSRRRSGLLAPVGDEIEKPRGLLLVWLPDFDLVRRGRSAPVIRIDGRDVDVVRVPAARLHRRHIIKYSASLCTLEIARHHNGPLGQLSPTPAAETTEDGKTSTLSAHSGEHHAQLVLEPALPDLRTLGEAERARGRWYVSINGARLTGGRWHAERTGEVVRMGLDVEERWKPGWLPTLMRVVVRLVPAFKRWPTTYRWRAELTLGPEPWMTSAWERIPPSGRTTFGAARRPQ